MGLFDKLKKERRRETSPSEPAPGAPEPSVDWGMALAAADNLRPLADVLVNDDAARRQLESWFDDPELYCKGPGSHRGMDDCAGRETDVPWLALADVLLDESRQAVELDWKGESEDLAWALNSVLANPELLLPEELFADQELTACFDVVNKRWRDKGWVLAFMDIDSDSYVLLVLTLAQLEAAAPLAARQGKTLTAAHKGL